MSNKLNLLLVSTRFPNKYGDGFSKKNYWLLKALSLKYSVKLFIIQNKNVNDIQYQEVKNYCSSIKVYQPNILDKLSGLFKSIKDDLPLQISLFYSKQAYIEIQNSLEECQIAVGSVIRSVQYIQNFNKLVIYDFADSIGLIYKKYADNLGFFERLLFSEESRRLLKYERKNVNKAFKSFFFNRYEALNFPKDKVKVVNHGFENQLIDNVKSLGNKYSDCLVLFGNLNYKPATHGALWFIKNVLPFINSEIRFLLLGANPPASLIKLSRKSSKIIVKGFVNDPYSIMNSCLASISPIFIGGGIQNKVIEGMAVGALNLVSPISIEPFKNENETGLILCENVKDWIIQINEIYKNPSNYLINRQKGKNYAKTNLDWNIYMSQVQIEVERGCDCYE